MVILLLLTALQAAPAPVSQIDPGKYIVGPTDVLTIAVFNQPQFSGKFTVEGDGTIAYPLLGRIRVAGLSIPAAEEEIRKRLSAGYVREPQVSVTIEQYRSQQVFVMGEVRLPGALQFTGSMTLIEALARVGATTERAGSEVLVVRARPGVQGPAPAPPNAQTPNAETIHVDLHALQTGTLAQNVTLQAGDTVFVPRAATFFVSGLVRTPGEYAIRPAMTVRQAVALAGGVTERGSNRRIQILRQVDGKETSLDVELKDQVRPGDTVVVRERLF